MFSEQSAQPGAVSPNVARRLLAASNKFRSLMFCVDLFRHLNEFVREAGKRRQNGM